MSLVYQDLLEMQEQQKQQAAKAQKRQYEYDSDEDIDEDEGTWEHKARRLEMTKTAREAEKLTKEARGKHHIGDFLPPDELTKFLKKVSRNLRSCKGKETRIISFFFPSTRPSRTGRSSRSQTTPTASSPTATRASRCCRVWAGAKGAGWEQTHRAGWTQSTSKKEKPLTYGNLFIRFLFRGNQSGDKKGLGVTKPHDVGEEDDEFDAYRKRMMLAYRFRPNPLVCSNEFAETCL